MIRLDPVSYLSNVSRKDVAQLFSRQKEVSALFGMIIYLQMRPTLSFSFPFLSSSPISLSFPLLFLHAARHEFRLAPLSLRLTLSLSLSVVCSAELL